jgi:hypothetical protein
VAARPFSSFAKPYTFLQLVLARYRAWVLSLLPNKIKEEIKRLLGQFNGLIIFIKSSF